jgi:hypothetical protein
MIQMNLNQILAVMKAKKYKVFTRPYELNIVGIRSTEEPNKFDDAIFVFFKDDQGNWVLKQYPATTDAGTYFLLKPINQLGTAMLKEGQWLDSWKIGSHRGKYTALTQSKPVTTYRDYDRNAVFDFGQNTSTGMYGINIHKAGKDSSEVDNWSAGCQVFKKSADFDEFMAMAQKQKTLYGNSFTYTLIDLREAKRTIRRRFLYFGVGAIIIGLLSYNYYKHGTFIPKLPNKFLKQ